MREYLFRGRRKGAPHEWLFGDLNHIDGKVYIFARTPETPLNSPDWFEVDPETVGQYTGLQDKNGTKIFEGDVVGKIDSYGVGSNLYVSGEVVFSDAQFKLRTNSKMIEMGVVYAKQYEVIGSIHDNPELLKQ